MAPLLGTIVMGTSTLLNVTGSYLYVGVCSNDGAMYLTNITFTYGQDDSAINLSNCIMYEDTNGQCNSKFSVAKGYFEGLSSTERDTFMTSNDYVILSARTRLLDWAKHLGKTITYEDGDYVISNSKIVSPIDGIISKNNNSSSVIVILSLIGITTFCGYIFLRKRKER